MRDTTIALGLLSPATRQWHTVGVEFLQRILKKANNDLVKFGTIIIQKLQEDNLVTLNEDGMLNKINQIILSNAPIEQQGQQIESIYNQLVQSNASSTAIALGV